MRRRISLISLTVLAGFAAAGTAFAAPASVAPLGLDGGVDAAAWTQQCWIENGPWGPHRQCRPVWVEPRRYGWREHGWRDRRDWDEHRHGGWGFGGGWGGGWGGHGRWRDDGDWR